MGTLITIGIYLALAAGAYLAFTSWTNGIRQEGAAAQLKADTPIIEACKVDRDTAVKANASLQADVKRLAGERDQQSAAVKELADAMAAQQAAKAKRVAADKPRIDALRADTMTLEERLALNTEGKTCDEKLSNIDSDLRAIVGGVRDPGTAATGSKPSPKPSARPSPGKGTLRLSQ